MIPEGFIEDAQKYTVVSCKSNKPIPIGGRIMFNLIVREQMTMDNIVATTGMSNYTCMIMVDYTDRQIYEMIGIAKQKLARIRGQN